MTRSFPTETLFGTCPDTTSPTTTTSSTSTHSTTAFTSKLTTAPPVVVTSHSSKTLDNGSVVLTTVVITSSVSPSYVYVSTAVPDQQVQGSNNNSHGGSKLGPIIGGAVGGVVLLIGLAAMVWFFVYVSFLFVDNANITDLYFLGVNAEYGMIFSTKMMARSISAHQDLCGIPACACLWTWVPLSSPSHTHTDFSATLDRLPSVRHRALQLVKATHNTWYQTMAKHGDPTTTNTLDKTPARHHGKIPYPTGAKHCHLYLASIASSMDQITLRRNIIVVHPEHRSCTHL